MEDKLQQRGLYQLCKQYWPNPHGKAGKRPAEGEGGSNSEGLGGSAHVRARFAAIGDAGTPGVAASHVGGGAATHGGRPRGQLAGTHVGGVPYDASRGGAPFDTPPVAGNAAAAAGTAAQPPSADASGHISPTMGLGDMARTMIPQAFARGEPKVVPFDASRAEIRGEGHVAARRPVRDVRLGVHVGEPHVEVEHTSC